MHFAGCRVAHHVGEPFGLCGAVVAVAYRRLAEHAAAQRRRERGGLDGRHGATDGVLPVVVKHERSLKTRPAADGLDSTPGSNPELQKHNNMQGPKEELW
jgi:hypothetical protein